MARLRLVAGEPLPTNRCYLAYLDVNSGEIRVRHSTDGARRGLLRRAFRPGRPAGHSEQGDAGRPTGRNAPRGIHRLRLDRRRHRSHLGRPLKRRRRDLRAARRIAQLLEEVQIDVRAPPFVSADVDPAGNVYLVWADCRFGECTSNGIVLVTSADGVVESTPLRADRRPQRAGAPFRARPGGGSRNQGRRSPPRRRGVHRLEGAGLRRLRDDRRLPGHLGERRPDLAPPLRLNTTSMSTHWIAATSLGPMLADYISVSYVEGRPVPVLTRRRARRWLRLVLPAGDLRRNDDSPVARGAPPTIGGRHGVLVASGLRKELSGDVLFDGVSLTVRRGDRVALAGANGAGKTTLLRAIVGETSLQKGQLSFAKDTRIALHDQRPPRGGV